ncbi:MAG: phosphoribosylformylglycinamidine synthase [Flavobacteriaceae bacterium]|nr:phosphoribosylformylglycinamidine synthase [Flavobacteriaceae bacterium]|tara:strand:- start:402 stop:4076 length:3675 start_codon:yes stop_codon:yes gene_type:complete
MIHFFGDAQKKVFAVQGPKSLNEDTNAKLSWLFADQPKIDMFAIKGPFIGPRSAMVTPWSTNAVEITQNMGINGVLRIEKFEAIRKTSKGFDPMISEKFRALNQAIFDIKMTSDPILEIEDIEAYNIHEGLSLSYEEIDYLKKVSEKIGRHLTDSEVFGFSQVNSEHCRHKIFNGTFIIDGKEQPFSLFKLIKETSKQNPENIVSAYKDNVAFIKGPVVEQFAPKRADFPEIYSTKDFESVISLKAETHNFPTTVEPFNGAATGSGGEIRDRLAGGKGSLPLAGTAVYMTSYSRLLDNRPWENGFKARAWLYQTPMDILIKASNGASDFGNKFGQPLICGSVLTFEHCEDAERLGFDKVIMQAGGIGYGKVDQALKDIPKKDDQIVILGGDNYRIGMGGAAVSSADTGEFSSGIELNAVQRSNPEMQKRAANAIRGMVESEENFIVSIHDHGAGGHLNCLSELVENTGGHINLDALPIGDPTLSDKELIGNESQERMGLVIAEKHLKTLHKIAARERSPIYNVGTVTNDHRFVFQSKKNGNKPMDLNLEDMFGSSPKTILKDQKLEKNYKAVKYDQTQLKSYIEQLLKLEAVACKDWLTNKVDRCVGGKVAKQQCVGPLQLPLNNVGVMALDYKSEHGVATSIGHAPISALIDPISGSRNAITEALTNIIWAPLENGLKSVSLSANWMWPCKNPGEDTRLYEAVKGVSEFAIALGINVPTGKDSLSMKQKYPEGDVLSPGTVVISAVAHCNGISKVVEPLFKTKQGPVYYINISQDAFKLGGSSFAQILNSVGQQTPRVKSAKYVKSVFNTIQHLILNKQIVAGHDIASGGLITTLLELCFSDNGLGAEIDLTILGEADTVKVLFSENSGIVFQAKDTSVETIFKSNGIDALRIGSISETGTLKLKNYQAKFDLNIETYRDFWYETSYLLDAKQTANGLAKTRYNNYKKQTLNYRFPIHFNGKLPIINDQKIKPKAAIIREKGSNSEREMANAMHLAGFEVRDVHMTDLISGRETLEDIQFIGAVGGFSNSDVLGSAKGWAGAFKYNEKAKKALQKFFSRKDTISVGICNGCQLWMELNLINPTHEEHGKMTYNNSQKHESAFTSVKIQKNNSVMLGTLEGATLGVWISHGEGKFALPYEESNYNIVGKYAYKDYPHNPNGSDYNTAMMCDSTGRHLVTMPHIERSIFPWNWAYYPSERNDAASPWLEAFQNAFHWVETYNIKI